MIDADRLTFAEALFLLGEAFNEPVSDTRAEAYFEALRDLPFETVSRACRSTLRTAKFFPKPADLREAIEGVGEDNAALAWGEVMQQIRRVGYMGIPTFSDARTLEAVRQVWGGWRRMCETLPGEGPELVGWVKQFKAVFQGVERQDASERLTMETVNPGVLAFIKGEQKRLS